MGMKLVECVRCERKVLDKGLDRDGVCPRCRGHIREQQDEEHENRIHQIREVPEGD